MLETAASLAITRNQEEEEVRRLEGALLQAKERVRETIIKQTGLEISVSFENKTRESLASNYALATDITNSSLNVYKELEAGRMNLSMSTSKLMKDLQDAVADVEKSTAMRVRDVYHLLLSYIHNLITILYADIASSYSCPSTDTTFSTHYQHTLLLFS